MNFGNMYAAGYDRAYRELSNESYEVRLITAANLRREMKKEPVGSLEWHGFVGMLTAINVLTGRNL